MPDTDKLFPKHYVDRETMLSNGVRIVTRAVDPAHYHPVRSFFAVNIMAGSRHAASGEMHFLEHLVNHPRHEEAYQRLGAERDYGQLMSGAWTGPHRTTYAKSSESGNRIDVADLGAALRLQLRVPREPDLSASNIESQRARISIELSCYEPERRRDWQFRNARMANPLPNGNIGSQDEVDSITRNDLIRAYERFYVGSNVVVPIVFPAVRGSGISHDKLVGIVDRELGALPAGEAAERFSSPRQNSIDLRLDGKLLDRPSHGAVQVAFAGVPRFSSAAPAQSAFYDIFGFAAYNEVAGSGAAYHYGSPELDTGDFGTAFCVSFAAPDRNIRTVLDIVAANMRRVATIDSGKQIDLYRRGKLKEHRQNYRLSDDAFEHMQSGLALTGSPQSPDDHYIGASRVTADDIVQYARTLIHGPIGLRADIGTDGDPSGKYVPLVSEFARKLRFGIPLPSSPQPAAHLMGFLPVMKGGLNSIQPHA